MSSHVPDSLAPLIHAPVEYVSSINGLVIISSAILAIIQYVNNHDSRIVGVTKSKIESFDLPSVDDLKTVPTQESCKRLRKQKDLLLLQADGFPSPARLVYCLLGLLPFYPMLHAGKFICPKCDTWIPYILVINSFVLFAIIVVMLFWLYNIKKSKTNFLTKAETFFQMATPFMNLWEEIQGKSAANQKKKKPRQNNRKQKPKAPSHNLSV